ncbi:MAG: hypothetical protein ABI947_19435 [Chloroflexota bacterium]
MSIIPGLMPYEAPEGRNDEMLEMIYHMIQEANQIHIDVLVASALSNPKVFDDYNRLSQLDEQIESLAKIRSVNKQRFQLHHYRQ